MKEPLVRFSVAIGGELLRRFDQYRENHRYPNRSEAVRGLMRDALIEEVIDKEESEAMGVITLIYDHHAGRIAERLTELQHGHLDQVVTTTHVHLDERRCLEVILLRGSTGRVRELADKLIGTKGVETGRLVLTAASPVSGHRELHAGHERSHDHHEHDAHARGEKHERPPGKDPARRRPGAL
ncbi:MAG: nickel-responsive transcriptional regulator NikR [Isosphaeraceae bacterium]